MPYFIFVACAAAPLVFLEVGLGQFMSQGNVSVWKICPVFKGKKRDYLAMQVHTNVKTSHQKQIETFFFVVPSPYLYLCTAT